MLIQENSESLNFSSDLVFYKHKHDIQNNSGMNVTISGFDVKRWDEVDKNVKISIKYSASPRKFKIIFTWD